MLNINHIETGNYVNGTGKRLVIWVQGCHFHCKNCGNPDTWSFVEKNLYSVQDLFNIIINESLLDGITFSGGEPFLQAKELAELAKEIKTHTNLTIQSFTGFELDEITESSQKELLQYIDTLIYGRFDSTKPQNNQKIWHNPNGNDNWQFNNSDIEIDLDINGYASLSGFPNSDFIKMIKDIQNERI